MPTRAEHAIKIADLVWVATALLHRENPDRVDFSKKEIQARAAAEDSENANRPGISLHISTHCVASKPASPARHRMLTKTRAGRRRLYREGDETHSDRRKGVSTPAREDLAERYRDLLDWYETEYNKPVRESTATRGASAETLLRLMGRISREDADELIRIINDCCGRVDANEW
jgi:hypothetical protein